MVVPDLLCGITMGTESIKIKSFSWFDAREIAALKQARVARDVCKESLRILVACPVILPKQTRIPFA